MCVEKSAASAENAEQFAVTMATDAFRIAIGVKPRNHSLADIIRWLRLMSEQARLTPSPKGGNDA